MGQVALFTGVGLSELGEKWPGLWLRSWSAESGTSIPSASGSSRAGPHRQGVSATASPSRTLPQASVVTCGLYLAILPGHSQVGDGPEAGQGARGVREKGRP